MGADDMFFLPDDDVGDRGGKGARMLPGRLVCSGCSVRIECLAYAMHHCIDYGVWGGMDSLERRKLAGEFPDLHGLLRHNPR